MDAAHRCMVRDGMTGLRRSAAGLGAGDVLVISCGMCPDYDADHFCPASDIRRSRRFRSRIFGDLQPADGAQPLCSESSSVAAFWSCLTSSGDVGSSTGPLAASRDVRFVLMRAPGGRAPCVAGLPGQFGRERGEEIPEKPSAGRCACGREDRCRSCTHAGRGSRGAARPYRSQAGSNTITCRMARPSASRSIASLIRPNSIRDEMSFSTGSLPSRHICA